MYKINQQNYISINISIPKIKFSQIEFDQVIILHCYYIDG